MRKIVFLLAAVLVAGCMNAEKRYEQASEDEASGRWASAADKYIDVLRRDPEFPGAREKALDAGNRAVDGWVRTAGGLEDAGRDERALAEYRKTDGLVDRAAVVGVVLTTPPDYTNRRSSTFHRAAEKALAQADAAAAEGRWRDAARAFAQVEARYELTRDQRERARHGRFDALLGAAREDVDAGRFDAADALVDQALTIKGVRADQAQELKRVIRAERYEAALHVVREELNAGHYQRAYALVDAALAIYGPAAEESVEARDLQDRAITEGTVRVVAVPLWRHDRAAQRVSAGLLADVDDILAEEYWANPPLFVAIADGRAVRRKMRRLALHRQILSPDRAALLGEQLGAEFIAVAHIARCKHDAHGTATSHIATTRDGREAEILVYRRRSMDVRCVFRIVDVTGQVVAEGRLDAQGSRKHTHAVHANGARAGELLLTREEHDWFDAGRLQEVDREIERDIAHQLAKELAEAVLNEVTKRLP